jgi:lipopolysaccharide export LptBFGC system permease protein LptF
VKHPCRNILRITLYALLPAFVFSQVERWVYIYNGVGDSIDHAYAVEYGADGNIYAAGYSTGDGTDQDFTVISLTANGNERWVYTYNGQVSQADIAYDLVYGLDNNIYAVGTSSNTTDKDITIISITADGIERWVYTYDGPLGQEDEAFSIVYGYDHNIYVAGRSTGTGTEYDFTIVSVDTAGIERWVYRYDRDTYFDGANSIAYGNDDNIYAAGYTYHWIPTQEFTIISVDTAGGQRWIKTIAGSGVVNETAFGIACGSDGNLYTVGSSWVLHYTVASIDTAGTWQWQKWYGETGHDNRAKTIVQGDDGRIYSAGYMQIGGDCDFTVAAHTSAGDSLWMVIYEGSADDHDVASSIDYGNNGRVYVAGWMTNSGTENDFTVIDVDTSGYQHWVYTYNGSDNTMDMAYSIVYGLDDNVYAAGCRTDSTAGLDFLVISLDTTTTGIVEENQYSMRQKQPLLPTYITGPFHIYFSNSYKIFDITGRQIHTLNPVPGIYFIEIDGVIVHKVIKIK